MENDPRGPEIVDRRPTGGAPDPVDLPREIDRIATHVHVLLKADPVLLRLGSVWVDWDERGIRALLVRTASSIVDAAHEAPEWWLPATQAHGANIAERLAGELRTKAKTGTA